LCDSVTAEEEEIQEAEWDIGVESEGTVGVVSRNVGMGILDFRFDIPAARRQEKSFNCPAFGRQSEKWNRYSGISIPDFRIDFPRLRYEIVTILSRDNWGHVRQEYPR